MVSRLSLVLFLFTTMSGGAFGADTPACGALLYTDSALLDALPARLRPLIESARVRGWVAARDAAWVNLHRALDDAFSHEGRPTMARLGNRSLTVRFNRTRLGDLHLTIDGAGTGNGFQFLELATAELAWVARARAEGKFTGLTIIGRELKEARLADVLASVGFRRSRFPGRQCYLIGLAGGLAGYAGGHLFFANTDATVENRSIYEEQRRFYRDLLGFSATGAGAAVGLVCFQKTGRDYSLELNPKELPSNPETPPKEDSVPTEDPIPKPVGEAKRS